MGHGCDAQNEHQNTTLDHSYYANRALLDGFFMSGLGMIMANKISVSNAAEKNSIEIEQAYRLQKPSFGPIFER